MIDPSQPISADTLSLRQLLLCYIVTTGGLTASAQCFVYLANVQRTNIAVKSGAIRMFVSNVQMSATVIFGLKIGSLPFVNTMTS